jgi:hypothetical protein
VPSAPLAPGTELGTVPDALATGQIAVHAAESHIRWLVVSPTGLYSARPAESTSTLPCPVLRALTGADELAEWLADPPDVPVELDEPALQPAAISGAAAAGTSHQSRRDRCCDNESQDIVATPCWSGVSLSDTAAGDGSFTG